MPFLTTALGIGSIVAGVGGAAASIAGSSAQASAAKDAAQLQFQLGEDSLAFQKQVYGENVARAQPWITAGTGAINTLSDLLNRGQGTSASGAPGTLQSFDPNNPFAAWTSTFQAPQLNDTTDPGYQARLNLGETALQNSAASRGGLLSTGTAQNLNMFAQDYASNEYSNVFSRAIQQYQQAFDIYNANQTNTFNRLAAVSGIGQTSATALGSQGQQAAGNIGYINSIIGGQVGQNILNAGTATASGYTGAANALGGIPSNLMSILLLNKLLTPPAAAGGATGP